MPDDHRSLEEATKQFLSDVSGAESASQQPPPVATEPAATVAPPVDQQPPAERDELRELFTAHGYQIPEAETPEEMFARLNGVVADYPKLAAERARLEREREELAQLTGEYGQHAAEFRDYLRQKQEAEAAAAAKAAESAKPKWQVPELDTKTRKDVQYGVDNEQVTIDEKTGLAHTKSLIYKDVVERYNAHVNWKGEVAEKFWSSPLGLLREAGLDEYWAEKEKAYKDAVEAAKKELRDEWAKGRSAEKQTDQITQHFQDNFAKYWEVDQATKQAKTDKGGNYVPTAEYHRLEAALAIGKQITGLDSASKDPEERLKAYQLGLTIAAGLPTGEAKPPGQATPPVVKPPPAASPPFLRGIDRFGPATSSENGGSHNHLAVEGARTGDPLDGEGLDAETLWKHLGDTLPQNRGLIPSNRG